MAAKPRAIALACLLLAGLSLRLWNFPARYELRDVDEPGYTYGGMLLWEGMTPGFKMAPAGLQTWVSWIYCAFHSAINLLVNSAENRASAPILRPFYAIDDCLFEAYRDASALKQIHVGILVFLSALGIAAAFQSGFDRAGIAGGLLSGGLTAMLPEYIQLSGMAKPYAAAWACALIAHYFAASQPGRRRLAGAAIFMGLAIASRIEMLLFLPILLWEVWNEPEPEGFGRAAVRLTAGAVAVTLLISPWLVTNMIGNLRTIATVRFSGQNTLGALLRDFSWFQGLGFVVILIIAGLAIGPPRRRGSHRWLLVIFLVLAATMLRPSPYGLRHHGAVLAAAIAIGPVAMAGLWRPHARMAVALAAALLAIPAIHTVAAIQSSRQAYVQDEATAWVENHIASGTRVYLCPTFHDPLPTAESANSLWAQVTDRQAWRKKFEQGLGRFQVSAARMPRALSEENLIQERGNRRRWFILGGRDGAHLPRFDIALISGGSPFDLAPGDAVAEYNRTGGVFIWRGARMDNAAVLRRQLGNPEVSWTAPNGDSVSVFYKPAVGSDTPAGKPVDSRGI